MVKVYYRNKEVELSAAKSLPWREDVLISFDGGKNKKSLHRDAAALKKALDENIVDFSYNPYSESFMFYEMVQSEDEVSEAVLDLLVQQALNLNVKISLPEAIALVNHPSVLKWILNKGTRCRHISGYGNSTLENFLRMVERKKKYAKECVALLKEYNAIDKEYLKEHSDDWKPSTIAAFI